MTQAETVFRLQGNYSSDELAKHTKAMIEAKGIESPDVTQMFSIKRDKTVYYYNTKEKYHKALDKFAKEDAIKKPTPLPVIDQAEVEKEQTLQFVKDNNLQCKDCFFMAINKSKHFICTRGHRANSRVKKKLEGCEYFTFKEE